MKSPILGGFSTSRSTNASDNEIYNLYLGLIETKDGKEPGALYMTPGLDLLLTVGGGPIRATHELNSSLYVVSRTEVYQVTSLGVVTDLGSITLGGSTPVSMFDNGRQVMIVDGTGAWVAPGGYPLTAGAVSAGGGLYVVNDTITLRPATGVSNAAVVITVTGVSSGAVTTFTVTTGGAVSDNTTATLSQTSTSGSGSGFVLNTPTFGSFVGMVPIAVPFANPIAGATSDGFGLLVFLHSQNIAQSAELDLSVWDALAYGVADQSPDKCISIAVIHDEAYVLKERNTEVWVDAGLANFAFQPLQGVHMEYGCVAPFSPAKGAEFLFWVSQNAEGQGMIVRAAGYQIVPISTQALMSELDTYPTLQDAIGYCYQQGGHVFYVLTFPTADKTWVYDLTTSELSGVPVWHRRAAFVNGMWHRHWGNSFSRWSGSPDQPNIGVVGDYQSGNLYTYNSNSGLDMGQKRKWLRRWRAMQTPREMTTRMSSLRIDMETGSGVNNGDDPQMMLRWSDDGGHTWSDFRILAAGKLGETAKYVRANRLGGTRRFARSDRIFELSSADVFKVAIVGAELEAE